MINLTNFISRFDSVLGSTALRIALARIGVTSEMIESRMSEYCDTIETEGDFGPTEYTNVLRTFIDSLINEYGLDTTFRTECNPYLVITEL